MPIYEYHCDPCDHTFETLVRNRGDAAHCPKCGGIELTKQFSVPAAAQTGARLRRLFARLRDGRQPLRLRLRPMRLGDVLDGVRRDDCSDRARPRPLNLSIPTKFRRASSFAL